MKIGTLQRKIKQGAYVRYDGSRWVLWSVGQPTALSADDFDSLFDSGAIESTTNHDYADGPIWIAKIDGCDPVANLVCATPTEGPRR